MQPWRVPAWARGGRSGRVKGTAHPLASPAVVADANGGYPWASTQAYARCPCRLETILICWHDGSGVSAQQPGHRGGISDTVFAWPASSQRRTGRSPPHEPVDFSSRVTLRMAGRRSTTSMRCGRSSSSLFKSNVADGVAQPLPGLPQPQLAPQAAQQHHRPQRRGRGGGEADQRLDLEVGEHLGGDRGLAAVTARH